MILKSSRYNFFVPSIEEKTIVFNGMTGFSCQMNKSEVQFVKFLLSNYEENIDKYSSIYNKLAEWGLMVEMGSNELEQLFLTNKKEVFLNKDYSLTINPTLECNFNCWYCYEEHKKGYMSQEVISGVKNLIEKKIKNERITELTIAWFGGEPLLYFNEVVKPIAEKALKLTKKFDIGFKHQITTNGYLITSDMVEDMVKLQMKSFQITIDGDKVKHDKVRNSNGNGSYNTIIKNIKTICDKIEGANVILRVNYDNKTLKNIHGLFDEFNEHHKKKIIVDFQRVWQTNKPEDGEFDELKNIIDFCKKKNYAVSYKDIQIGRGYSCKVDRYHHKEINYDGGVYECTARDYTEEYKIGNLERDGVIKFKKDYHENRYYKATFDNDKCKKCKFLPLCFGPCSQKMLEMNGGINKVCNIENEDLGFYERIINYHHNKAIFVD